MNQLFLHENWKMKNTAETEWIPAAVPGSVYGDLLAAGKIPDPYVSDNADRLTALLDSDYAYETNFSCPAALLAADEILLRFEGLDTLADISVNGMPVGHADNMHRTYEYSVKPLLKPDGNVLSVRFSSPNRFIADAFSKMPTRGTKDCMQGFGALRKAHYMFGWDWAAHLPDAGIWRPVSLVGVHAARIESVEILQFREGDAFRLEITPALQAARGAEADLSALKTAVTVTAPDGRTVYSGSGNAPVLIENPALWWPNGYGKQPLYTVLVTLLSENGAALDTWSRRIGLRTVTVDRTPDEWGERFAFQVNGVRIFSMGADYIPEDHLLGRTSKARTCDLLKKAVFANFNTLRVWGGGFYPDDDFYDACDELGLLVWQDFMFACSMYDLAPAFKENITAEFIDNLKRIRHHASLGLLCGNNEMEMFTKDRTWVSKESEIADYAEMYENLLPRIVKQYAKQTYYWPASPSSGGGFDLPNDENRGDTHYWAVWHSGKPFTEFRNHYFRYLSEFGFQSFPLEKTVEAFLTSEHERNVFSYEMEKHQRNGAANGKILNYLAQTFRCPDTFENMLYASQLLQAEAIRYGVEHFRRNREGYRCMGAVYWQFNDCWPVASWSSIDYFGRLKALHYAARRFFSPILISCEEEGMLSYKQEMNRLPYDLVKSVRLAVSNETRNNERLTVFWALRDSCARVLSEGKKEISVPALSVVSLDRTAFPEADPFTDYVSYRVEKDGAVLSEGTVLFSVPKYFRFENPHLKASVDGEYVTVSADAYARSVEILNENEDLVLSDNYFDLNGNSKTVKVISGKVDTLRLRSVFDIG